jgi:hypothetical protein
MAIRAFRVAMVVALLGAGDSGADTLRPKCDRNAPLLCNDARHRMTLLREPMTDFRLSGALVPAEPVHPTSLRERKLVAEAEADLQRLREELTRPPPPAPTLLDRLLRFLVLPWCVGFLGTTCFLRLRKR